MTSMPPRVISRPRKPLVGTVNLLTKPNLEWNSQTSNWIGKGTDSTVKTNSRKVAPGDNSPNENMVSKKSSKPSIIGKQSGNIHANYREKNKINAENCRIQEQIQGKWLPISRDWDPLYLHPVLDDMGNRTIPKKNEKKLSSLVARDYITSNSDESKSRLMHADRQKRTKVVKEILDKGNWTELNSTRLTKSKATNGKIYKPGSARNGINTEVRPATKDGTTQKSKIATPSNGTVTKSLSTNNKQSPKKIPPKKNEAKTVKITTGAPFFDPTDQEECLGYTELWRDQVVFNQSWTEH